MSIFTRKPPWYGAGLAFECVRCGRCCAGPEEGYVWVTDEEIAAIAHHLRIPEDLMRRFVRRIGGRCSLVERKDNNDCIFLTASDAGGQICRIYLVRPSQCRTWPFWPGNLTSPEAWANAQRRCPGINQGPICSREEIEAKRDATGR